MTYTVGRNEPCPCGSGKKYKRCHGASSAATSISPHIARANAFKAVDAELTQRLLRFARRRYGADWLPDVLDGQGGLEGPAVQLLVPWMLPSCRAALAANGGPRMAARRATALDG